MSLNTELMSQIFIWMYLSIFILLIFIVSLSTRFIIYCVKSTFSEVSCSISSIDCASCTLSVIRMISSPQQRCFIFSPSILIPVKSQFIFFDMPSKNATFWEECVALPAPPFYFELVCVLVCQFSDLAVAFSYMSVIIADYRCSMRNSFSAPDRFCSFTESKPSRNLQILAVVIYYTQHISW